MIWLGFAVMAFAAVLLTVWPLFAGSNNAVAIEDGTSAVLIDQLDEVQRDFDRGLISAEEASAAKLEIKRRILALSRKAPVVAAGQPGDGRTAIFIAAALIPVFAAGYYMINGAPGVSDLAFSERQAERQEGQKIADLAEKLFERLNTDPTGGPTDGWMLLGQTYARMGQIEGAVHAFKTASEREDATSATLSMLAEAMIRSDGGTVTPLAEAAIDRSLEMDPTNPAATFYKAVAVNQAGNSVAAHDLLVRRLEQADGFAPWMEIFVVEANRIGGPPGRAPLRLADFAPMPVPTTAPGPSADDVAAARDLSEEDRSAFIRSMVDRLATRLEDTPEDLEGWMRLANAYIVLGERDSAISAYKAADALLQNAPDDDPRRDVVDRALAQLEE